MNNIESEEASNDDTNIISDLLNSAEAMQSSSVPTTTTSANITKMQVQQKDELQIVQNTGEISATFCDSTKQNIMISLQHSNSTTVGSGLLNSTQYSDSEDLNKLHIRHVHIPYILNGELYQIQTQDGENVTVKCCHCPPDRVYRGSVRSTGNFHMHIKRRHPDLLEKLHDMKVNALLERRDRLMRNRKITHRNNRNRTNSSNGMCSFKNEEKPELIATSTPGSQITLDSSPELSLMHTHKLKIKTVFQRHQLQQKEAAEMKNWNKADYVVMPISKLSTNDESDQPINYSLKSSENHESHALSVSSNINQQQQQQREKRISNDSTNQISNFNNFTNLTNQPTNLSTTNNNNNNARQPNGEYACEKHTNNRNVSTSSISISCPSVMSSYSSNHQYEMETNRSYSSQPPHHHNMSIIKPEHLILGRETEAIDLTMHTDSGIFSNSEDSASVQDNNNNNHNNNSINNRAGSQKSNTANISTIDVERNGDAGVNNITTNSGKWQELLMQVENSLRDIQREMNVRNQIESNRMFLDIAKFKHLNPGFQFNW